MPFKQICWDFDRTMGLFNKPDETSEESENEDEAIGARFGMRQTLGVLLSRGYRHVITTANEIGYPLKTLEQTDFEAYIDNIFGVWEILGDYSKNYDVVRDWLGWTKEEAVAKMVVIGDNYRKQDIPYNLPCLFIEQDYGYRYDSKLIDIILQRLEQENPDNLSDAFGRLEGKRQVECQGVTFSMEYRLNQGILVPVISDIFAESYLRPVIPLED